MLAGGPAFRLAVAWLFASGSREQHPYLGSALLCLAAQPPTLRALLPCAPPPAATIYPLNIAWAATFDDELAHRAASQIGDEMRAHYNRRAREGWTELAYTNCFGPHVHIVRWGRAVHAWQAGTGWGGGAAAWLPWPACCPAATPLNAHGAALQPWWVAGKSAAAVAL